MESIVPQFKNLVTSIEARYCNVKASCTTLLSITPILFNCGFFCSLGETTFTRYFQVQGRKIANAFNPLFCQRPMAHKCCHRKFTHKGWCVNGGGHQKSGDWPLRPLAFVIHGCLLKRNTVSRITYAVKNKEKKIFFIRGKHSLISIMPLST